MVKAVVNFWSSFIKVFCFHVIGGLADFSSSVSHCSPWLPVLSLETKRTIISKSVGFFSIKGQDFYKNLDSLTHGQEPYWAY